MELKKPESGWSVDASCVGNPGPMEYRCVDIATGKTIFRSKTYPLGTNNLGEFLGLVHALAKLKQENLTHIKLFTDSNTALAWLKKRAIKTTLPHSEATKNLLDDAQRAITWLQNNPQHTPIQKWNTEAWGEIPADFGRK